MMSAQKQPEKPLSRFAWWVCFLLATFIMSLWFQTFKVFTLVPNWGNGLSWLGVNLLLALVVMLLIYDSYVQEKIAGRIAKPARLFEWMIQKRILLKGDLE